MSDLVTAKIIEIFSSIQGEGLWIGKPQVFVRFAGCRLQCTYCDTPLTHQQITESRVEEVPYSKNYTPKKLIYTVDELNQTLENFTVRSLAITGGEPLEQVDFLEEWFPTIYNTHEILLETNGVEVAALEKVIPFVSVISLDLKLPSSSGEKSYFKEHREFIKLARKTRCYAKIVFDESMTSDEEVQLSQLCQSYPEIPFVFQPVSPLRHRDMPKIFEIFNRFAEQFPGQVRLIPQMHKVLGVA